MKAESFIASRLRFRGRMAVIAIAISFLIMIVAVAISGGFRKEIRAGISDMTGDVMLSGSGFNYYGETDPVCTSPSYLPSIEAVKGVQSVSPVIYRAGIVKAGNDIHGVLVKGVAGRDSSLMVSIPATLSAKLGLGPGDDMLTYFIGEKVQARRFKVADVYESMVETDDKLVVFAPIQDLRRLNGWEDDQASVLEVRLDENWSSRSAARFKTEEIGMICMLSEDAEEAMVATAAVDRYSQIFDWLDLIDFNVVAILILMTIVAGFNMISGLLILLFRNISTIGTLKALGMPDRGIAGVFLRVSARIVAIGMLTGNAAALLFCLIQGRTHLITLNPENYFVSFVPVQVDLSLIITADMVSFAVIMLLLLIPSLFIAKVDPAVTVKAE